MQNHGKNGFGFVAIVGGRFESINRAYRQRYNDIKHL